MSRESCHRNRLVMCALLATVLISCRRGVLAQQDCGQPTEEEMANGNFVGDTTHGGTAALLCSTGYEGGGQAYCNDGTWTIPACNAKECVEPTVANAVFYGSRKFGEYNNITCNDGYEGSADITCTADKIWESLPTCSPVDCGDPGIANGNNAGSNLFGKGGFIVCDAGYTGGGLFECQADGTWDSKPPCNPKQCAKQAITNGEMVGALEYNSADSRVECDNGYVGDAAITCTTSAAWQLPLPECTPQVCTPDPTIESGVLEGDRFYSGSAFVNCYDGYEGDGAATCLPDGTWDLANLPACTAKDCLQPDPAIGNGFLSGSTKFGEGASISCDAGYEVVGDDTALCQTDGTWAALPTCDPVECPPVIITNGAFSGSREYNSQADIICNEGYVGDAPIECQTDASWGQIPTCDPIDCNALTVPHGQFFGDTFYTGSTTILCDTGYDLVGTAACGTSGTWESVPTCDPKDCLTPTIGFGSFSGDTTYDGSASVICDAGYDGSGPAVCGSDGFWQVLPTCVPKDCGPTGVLFSTLLGSSKFGEGAFISCYNGYTGGGPATCNVTAIWEVLPECQPKKCAKQAIANGEMVGALEYNSADSRVECDNGYVGDAAITCTTSATWQLPLPECTPQACPALSNPASGAVIVAGYAVGDTATYMCSTGYLLSGDATRTCQADNTWSGSEPTCMTRACPALCNPASGAVIVAGYAVGDTATYTCSTGYLLSGDATRTCQADNIWSGSEPTCMARACPALSNLASGAVIVAGYAVGDTATYTFSKGYLLKGDA